MSRKVRVSAIAENHRAYDGSGDFEKIAKMEADFIAGEINKVMCDSPDLIVLPEVNPFVIKSCANIEGVKTTQWNTINVYDILNCDTFIVAQGAVAKIEEVYAR